MRHFGAASVVAPSLDIENVSGVDVGDPDELLSVVAWQAVAIVTREQKRTSQEGLRAAGYRLLYSLLVLSVPCLRALGGLDPTFLVVHSKGCCVRLCATPVLHLYLVPATMVGVSDHFRRSLLPILVYDMVLSSVVQFRACPGFFCKASCTGRPMRAALALLPWHGMVDNILTESHSVIGPSNLQHCCGSVPRVMREFL